MDTEGQLAALCKKIEKLEWEIRNEVLTKKQKDNKQDKIKQLKEQIEGLESQLTTLKITTRKPVGFMQSCFVLLKN